MSLQTIANPFASRTDRRMPSLFPPTIPSSPQAGDNIIVRLCIAIAFGAEPNEVPTMQVLTAHDERLPVPLSHVRSLANIRRCVRLLLKDTMALYGITPPQMTYSGLILPTNHNPQNNGLAGVTDSDPVWQTYTNRIADIYHQSCPFPEACSLCSQPAYIVACFPFNIWTTDPGTHVPMLDGYNEEHGRTLRQLNTTEEQRYRRITQHQVSPQSAATATVQSTAPPNTPSFSSRSNLPPITPTIDPTRGPKGRSLIGSARSTPQKRRDYTEGTLYPSTASQGIKAESDTCLTCIRYGRKCKGTTMTWVQNKRTERPSQWKCEQCCSPQRRCLWRRSMNSVTTYEEAFTADGGRRLVANTVQGRQARALGRSGGVAVKDESEEDEEYDEDFDDTDEEYNGDADEGDDGYLDGDAEIKQEEER